MGKLKRKPLRLGFVGLGKYGYATMRAIMSAGHHAWKNMAYEDYESDKFYDHESKKKEVLENIRRLDDLPDDSLQRRPAKKNLEDLVKWLASDEERDGVLLLSLNKQRGEEVLNQLKKCLGELKGEMWIFSSISKMSIGDIRKKTGIAGNENIRIVRYLQNLGISKGKGLIAASPEECYREDARRVLEQVFFGLGEVLIIREKDIDAARVIVGSTIGVIAYFADILSSALARQQIEGLSNKEEIGSKVVGSSISGALALASSRNIKTWRDVYEQVCVTPGKGGEKGTTELLVDEICQKIRTGENGSDLFSIIDESYRNIIARYNEPLGGNIEH